MHQNNRRVPLFGNGVPQFGELSGSWQLFSCRFVCVGVNGNIDFEDNLYHHQLFAQALHLFNAGERFWLNDEEIQTLIQENEPFQKIGNALNDVQFNFKSKRKTNHMEYWLIEK